MKNKIFEPTDCLNVSTLEKYLKQDLPKDKMHLVEHHLIDCPFCSDAVDGLIEYIPENDVSVTLDKIGTKLFQEKEKTTPFPFLKIAATFLFLVIGGMALFQYETISANQSLASKFYETYAGGELIITRGQAQEKKFDPFLEKSIHYFEAKSFKEAESLLYHYLERHVENDLAKFYLAMTKMEFKEYSEAIELLEEVRINDLSKYDEASWYLAVCYLEQNSVEKGKQILLEIINSPTSVKKEKANLMYMDLLKKEQD